MDGGTYTIRWDEESRVANAPEVICGLDGSQNNHYNNMQNETIIPDTDQIAAENLMFLAQDIVGQMAGYVEPVGVGTEYEQGSSEVCHADTMEVAMECQVTEEVITDDWVVEAGGQERIEVPLEQLATAAVELKNEYNNDIDVPLPTDQDQYTAMRPWPCDFCSRRFRKKATLMNHMVAHQNDRPYGCNLCGIRYVRRADLMNHLKVHASVPELDEVADNSAQYENYMRESPPPKPVRKKRGKKKQRSPNQNGSARCRTSSGGASATSARTQMYRARALPAPSALAPAPAAPPPPSPPPPLPALREPTDPRKPFVCQHCGVGFAREKALASHSRIHGGDSPLDCGVCGELCWSRDALALHMRQRHPDLPAEAARDPTASLQDGMDSDFSLAASEVESGGGSSPLGGGGASGQPELYCKDCGAGFQRADLLRRHAAAAHSYKKELVSDWEYGDPVHSCDVCGEGFRDALDLLAHAESHARNYSCWRCGSTEPSHECSSLDLMNEMVGEDGLALIPCPFCGKGFRNRARLRRHVCPARFADGSRMPVATPVTHNGAKQFPCRECGKTFGSRSSQQIHIRIHTGERPYGCRFCWKAFADGGTLRKHERIHTGEKPYACAVCPRAFNQRVVLREHVRSHHSAPDSRRGNGAGVFCCSVCARTLHSSAELVQHLIEHCDANTAMKRQPQVGPRKYKRRRRLKPHEDSAEERRIEQPPLEELSVEEPPVKEPSAPSRRRRPRRYTTHEEPNVLYDAGDYEMPDMEDAYSSLKEENVTIPAPPPKRTRVKGRRKKSPVPAVSRPKMIHTQKSSPSTSTHTTGRKKRGRAPASVTTQDLDTSIRPRTKNVKYHDVPPRHQTATFPKREMLSDELADDLRAILLPTLSVKQEVVGRTETELAMATSSIEMMAEMKSDPDYGRYRCEMCSEAFHDREQLLLHVPIHI